MFKKSIGTLLTLFLAFGILSISIGKVWLGARFFSSAATITPTQAPQASPTAIPKVNYYLAYPGVLPDHPFYKIKTFRDRVWLTMTTNVVRKAELLLLFADKRFGAGKVLIEGNQVDLGLTTMQKGVKYLERAIDQAFVIKSKGIALGPLADNLKKAPFKYLEIVIELKDKVDSNGKTVLADLEIFLNSLAKKVETL